MLYRVLLGLLVLGTMLYGISNLSNEVDYSKNQPPIPPVPDKTRYELSLYFGNPQNDSLVLEKRVIVTSEQMEEKLILEELIKGPRNKTLTPSIPMQTQLLSIKTVDNICYVNLSNHFLDIYKWSNLNEAIVIWSIVNSLTELKHIDSVQILVEGNKEKVFQDFYALNEPFYRNEELLRKEVLTPFVIFNQFLDLLKSEEYKKAYDMLDKESIEKIDFVRFKLMMGNYARELRNYEIYRYQTQKYSTKVILVLKFRKKNLSFANELEDITEQWQITNENGLWKIKMPD